ncbi:MAG: ATP-binding protein [Gemmataceae bacterium]|nr:ATP-binding protein [Gemmataceae bacterium]
MIPRRQYLTDIRLAFQHNPVCAILGPRQCGKTTLARTYARGKTTHFFDLETAVGRARLANPEMALGPLQGLVVIDEIQRQQELFTTLRPLADRKIGRAKVLILGSAAPELVRGVSDTLAGRVAFIDLTGFQLRKVGWAHARKLWLRGGFPRSFLARSNLLSFEWRRDFLRTFLERDVPQLGIRIPTESLRRFWMMLAHFHGQIWNGSELARSLGVTEHTVRGYLDVLIGTYVLRALPPWFENISKRQFKSPKVYVRDSGLLHFLLGAGDWATLEGHPKFGASWEGFALEQILGVVDARQAYFWGTHAGAELDLLLLSGAKRFGVEFKTNDAPDMTKSLHVALADLRLDKAWIVYPGHVSYPVHEKVDVISLPALLRKLEQSKR